MSVVVAAARFGTFRPRFSMGQKTRASHCAGRTGPLAVLVEDGASLVVAARRSSQSVFRAALRAGAASSLAVGTCSPRSQRQVVYAAARPVCAVGQGAKVRPNKSFKRTRTGMALGPCNALVYRAPHGPSATPLRSA